MTDIDRLVADIAGARDRAVATPAVEQALTDLADRFESMPEADLRPRRRRARSFVAVAVATLCVGVAVPTGAAASALDWASARTGLFGRAGEVENDTSEFLDASDPGIRAVVERHTGRFALPAGATWDPAYDAVVTNERVLVQEHVVAAIVARTAVCAWEREWLRAHAAGNAARAAQAAGVVASAASWPDLVAGDPTGGLRRHLGSVANAAATGDEQLVRADVAVNCAAPR